MKNKAFTLIELLVVVLIIGILAAIAVPQYQKAVFKARAIEAKSNLYTIAKAQQVFYLQNGYFTSDLTLLDTQITNANSIGYVCNTSTADNADCWAIMDTLKYNFAVWPSSVGHYCVAVKDSWGEKICKEEGSYIFDTSDGKSSYYRF